MGGMCMDWSPVGGRPLLCARPGLGHCSQSAGCSGSHSAGCHLPGTRLRCERGRDPCPLALPNLGGETDWRLDSWSDLWVFR